MASQLAFQDFGVRKSVPHLIDPLVAIQIEEAIVTNGRNRRVTGVLFGKQQANNLVITSALITSIGELNDNDEFRLPENLESLLQYHERVHSTKCVGLFAAKPDFDRESYAQIGASFKHKTTSDFLFLTVGFNLETASFDYKAFTTLRNKYFKDLFVVMTQVPVKFSLAEDDYAKSELISNTGHIPRRAERAGDGGRAGQGTGVAGGSS